MEIANSSISIRFLLRLVAHRALFLLTILTVPNIIEATGEDWRFSSSASPFVARPGLFFAWARFLLLRTNLTKKTVTIWPTYCVFIVEAS